MNFDKYENKLKYPKLLKRFCPECKTGFGKQDNFCCKCGNNVKQFWDNVTAEHSLLVTKYNKETERLCNVFKQEALDDVGLLEHPKANDIFYFAWEHGHSSGYHEVYYWLQEISDLFKD